MPPKDKKNSSDTKELRSDRAIRFRSIYEEYFERLCSYAFVITNSYDTAKDVVSDVFYNLWKSEVNLSEIKELKSYLFTSVKNQAIRSVSKNPMNFQDFHSNLELKSIEYLNPEDLMIGKELAAKIDEVIDSMPPKCQLVFRMVKEEKLKYDEVAVKLEITTSMVKQHMIAGLKIMRSSLNQHFTDAKVIKLISSLGCIVVLILALI